MQVVAVEEVVAEPNGARRRLGARPSRPSRLHRDAVTRTATTGDAGEQNTTRSEINDSIESGGWQATSGCTRTLKLGA